MCFMCVLILYWICEYIGFIEDEVFKDIIKIKVNGLMKEMNSICYDLERLIEDENWNFIEIDENVDVILEMVRDFFEMCMNYLKEVKERQLNCVVKFLKDSKMRFEVFIQEFENRKLYLKRCYKMLKLVFESGDKFQFLLIFFFMKENMKEICKMKFEIIELNFKIINCEEIFQEIKKIEKYIDFWIYVVERVIEIFKFVNFGENEIVVKVINDWVVLDVNFLGGVFL